MRPEQQTTPIFKKSRDAPPASDSRRARGTRSGSKIWAPASQGHTPPLCDVRLAPIAPVAEQEPPFRVPTYLGVARVAGVKLMDVRLSVFTTCNKHIILGFFSAFSACHDGRSIDALGFELATPLLRFSWVHTTRRKEGWLALRGLLRGKRRRCPGWWCGRHASGSWVLLVEG